MQSHNDITELVGTHRLVTDQITKPELVVLLRTLQTVLASGVVGDVVELGCYEGTSALFIQRMLTGSDKKLHLYDSFQGLPKKGQQDNSGVGDQFQAGELHADKKKLIQHFRQSGLVVPTIKKAWFSELAARDMPEHVAFAFLDGDFYESIIDSLELVWKRLSPGAMVVIDDYQSEALPGVRRAIEKWSQSHRFELRVESSLAVLSRCV